jgi:hypothetical protein
MVHDSQLSSSRRDHIDMLEYSVCNSLCRGKGERRVQRFAAETVAIIARRMIRVLSLRVFIILAIHAFSLPCAAQSPGDRDTDFRIALVRQTTGMSANITTTTTYPCAGYELRTQVIWNDDTVNVHILGMMRPFPCIQMFSEASGRASLGSFTKEISFIRFHYRDDIDIYEVTQSKGRLSVIPVQQTFTQISGVDF